jgi:hypothetical protein
MPFPSGWDDPLYVPSLESPRQEPQTQILRNRVIGRGTYGVVYEGIRYMPDSFDTQSLAVKGTVIDAAIDAYIYKRLFSDPVCLEMAIQKATRASSEMNIVTMELGMLYGLRNRYPDAHLCYPINHGERKRPRLFQLLRAPHLTSRPYPDKVHPLHSHTEVTEVAPNRFAISFTMQRHDRSLEEFMGRYRLMPEAVGRYVPCRDKHGYAPLSSVGGWVRMIVLLWLLQDLGAGPHGARDPAGHGQRRYQRCVLRPQA